MPHRPFTLDRDSVILPKGTRVVLRQSVEGTDGFVHRAGSLGTVCEVCLHTYTVRTPSGRTLEVQRDQITSQRTDLLESLGRRQREHQVEARQGRRTAKTLLYAYRVALTGVHLLRTDSCKAWSRGTAPAWKDTWPAPPRCAAR